MEQNNAKINTFKTADSATTSMSTNGFFLSAIVVTFGLIGSRASAQSYDPNIDIYNSNVVLANMATTLNNDLALSASFTGATYIPIPVVVPTYLPTAYVSPNVIVANEFLNNSLKANSVIAQSSVPVAALSYAIDIGIYQNMILSDRLQASVKTGVSVGTAPIVNNPFSTMPVKLPFMNPSQVSAGFQAMYNDLETAPSPVSVDAGFSQVDAINAMSLEYGYAHDLGILQVQSGPWYTTTPTDYSDTANLYVPVQSLNGGATSDLPLELESQGFSRVDVCNASCQPVAVAAVGLTQAPLNPLSSYATSDGILIEKYGVVADEVDLTLQMAFDAVNKANPFLLDFLADKGVSFKIGSVGQNIYSLVPWGVQPKLAWTQPLGTAYPGSGIIALRGDTVDNFVAIETVLHEIGHQLQFLVIDRSENLSISLIFAHQNAATNLKSVYSTPDGKPAYSIKTELEYFANLFAIMTTQGGTGDPYYTGKINSPLALSQLDPQGYELIKRVIAAARKP